MKTLILCRHAKSSWKDPELADWQRPLNRRGKRDAPAMGARLARRGAAVDLILVSTAKRAWRTAVLIARQLGYPKERIRREARLYAADSVDLLEVIHGVDDGVQCLMLVGHNPECTELAEELGGLGIDNIPTCGMVGLEFSKDSWADVARGEGIPRYFDFPKKSGP